VIYALNQSTGGTVWNFSTVDSPDLWGHPEINSGGGCWYTPSIDLKSGIMFWGTGNPAPFVGTPEYPNGASRPGPNLYTNTLLALDHRNGSLQWFTQVIPHGLFDYDLQLPPILARANWNGIDQDIVIAGGKMGRVYGFNRSTGAILWETGVGKHQNDQLAALPPGFTQVYPGAVGGIETPMAYADGVVYAAYNNVYENWSPIASYDGNVTPYIQPYSEGSGGLVAIETDTGQILWERKFDSMDVGGATVVNDLVFTGTFNGTLYAFNRTTGEQVWTYQAPDRIIAWPAVANDTLVWPAGGGFRSNGTPSLIALKVGG
ncbi:MAG TPA: PQQ-binding-like beta-propeller repeat protein, partial [Desulfobaccales bacterium]|nr:PQQ-binding-like beta-propeller repeat protein [Desulfobaccales bacterium]